MDTVYEEMGVLLNEGDKPSRDVIKKIKQDNYYLWINAAPFPYPRSDYKNKIIWLTYFHAMDDNYLTYQAMPLFDTYKEQTKRGTFSEIVKEPLESLSFEFFFIRSISLEEAQEIMAKELLEALDKSETFK